MLNMEPPIAMAAKYTALPILPTIATSIIPKRGVVILAIIAGMDSASISLLIELSLKFIMLWRDGYPIRDNKLVKRKRQVRVIETPLR